MQQEVEQFTKEGKVVASTQFGPSSANAFSYSLIKDNGSEAIMATFHADTIQVHVPTALAEEWAKTEIVGVEGLMPLEAEKYLYILIEKDFKCLQERPHEDESDAFPNLLEMKC